jgi:hypothetical protein
MVTGKTAIASEAGSKRQERALKKFEVRAVGKKEFGVL